MEQQSRVPNWMNDPTMLGFYRQVQAAGESLEPDPVYLSDVSLGRYPSYKLKDLAISEHLRSFLTKIGLPGRFLDWRSPDEESGQAIGNLCAICHCTERMKNVHHSIFAGAIL